MYLFLARGNEPGWVLTVDGNKLQWITNYGVDTFLLKLGNQNTIRKNNFDSVIFAVESIEFSIRKASCRDDMYEKDTGTHKVNIYYNDQVYRGCGKWQKKK